MNTMLEDRDRTEAFERAMHRTLTATEAYARKIHWWVRLFGVLCLVSVGLAVFFAMVAGVALSSR